jgi:hypothetical protein
MVIYFTNPGWVDTGKASNYYFFNWSACVLSNFSLLFVAVW